MKIKPIIIGMVASLVLPLAGANAGAVLEPGLIQAGAGVDLEHSAAYADHYGRHKHKGKKGSKGSKGDKGSKGSKSPSKPPRGSKKG